MSEKPTPYETCSRKIVYHTPRAARDAARRCWFTRREVVDYYECPYCGKYHLTSHSRR